MAARTSNEHRRQTVVHRFAKVPHGAPVSPLPFGQHGKPSLAPIDVVLLLVLLVGAWRGFTKGLVLSVASLVGLVGGIWAASHFSHTVAEQLSPHVIPSVNTLHMASLALTFLLVGGGSPPGQRCLKRSSTWWLWGSSTNWRAPSLDC